jgi:tetratricopeptide (TPR) repeat protein
MRRTVKRERINPPVFAMKKACWFVLGLLVLGISGCATTERPQPVRMTGNIMVDGPNAIAQGPARDKVLWQYRTAAAAMRKGEFELAKELLDDALLNLGGIVGDKSARQARSYFHGEDKKTFRGEPYERVMAYFYRGILYWMDGEPDNARACFRSALIQDTDTENNEYAADYALLEYLDGLATTKLGGDGSDAFKRAQAVARIVKPPPYTPDANVLLFIEYGRGPTKYATGEYREQLRIRTTPTPVHNAVIKVDGRQVKVGPYDDLDFQATTRGGRVMDHILANKAVFKSTTSTVGDAAIISGAVLATSQRGRNSAADEIGAGLIVAGLLSKIVSASTTPTADTRAWDNLPRYLSFANLSLSPGEHTLVIEFTDAAGKLLPNLTKTVTVNVPPDDTDKVVFISDQSITPKTL